MGSTSKGLQRQIEKVELAILEALNYVRDNIAPRDTGNLALNATKAHTIPSGEDEVVWEIYVDEGGGPGTPGADGIAPYMVYTNEPWISPKWHGKKNPNEGWWQEACEYIILYVTEVFDGELKEEA